MKRRLFKIVLCLTLIAAMVIAPMCASASSTAYIYKVNVKNAYLRSKSGSNSTVIAKLPRGSKVLYWGSKSGSMYKVYTTSGKTGYIYKDFLSQYGAVNKSQIGVLKVDAPVYKQSGSKLKRNGTAKAGTMVMVYAYNDDWVRCKSVTGKTGYIPRVAVKKAF